ncbi:outer membrane beta-barrel protein [Aureibacter tunicatorum]|uniref:Outer membrane protein beta-barrel domain-containing protein n=1 Tax=Aureibacter tunicatorum TaxID=866807 RepID=A0AAE3XNX9_9BACT|nr:outer membrane beta-barrel protein [Aureibacter tunicatorum]MDR6239369.1 hypothetical protein [Aureibacter tunicatorum]BDD04708.1 hypothetical protein AUTU_21910 [Aureibacter tunicatorum]
MKIKYALLQITLFLVFTSTIPSIKAQSHWVEGKITTKKGETLSGYIDFKEWSKSPKFIRFKSNDKEKDSRKFYPNDLINYEVDGEKYISAIIESEISPRISSTFDFDKNIQTETDTAFIRVIISGSKMLYHYKNNFGNDNYYINVDNEIKLLTYKKYKKHKDLSVNHRMVFDENKRYLAELSLYLNDCQKISKTLKTTSYNTKSLEKLFIKYYECRNNEKFEKSETDEGNFKFWLIAGMTVNDMRLTFSNFGMTTRHLHQANISNSFSPTFGISAEYIIPRNHNKWSIYNELHHSSFNFEYDYESNTNVKISASYLKIINMIRYKYFTNNKSHIFINAGMGNGIMISSTNKKTEEYGYTEKRIRESEAIPAGMHKYDLSLNFGAGYSIKRLSLEIRYENTLNKLPQSMSLGSTLKRYHFLIGYHF